MKKTLAFVVVFLALAFLYFNQDRTALHVVTKDKSYSFTKTNHLQHISTPSHTVEYLLDAQGLKLAKKVNGVLKERYLWAGEGQLLAVLDADGNVLRQYAYADAQTTLPHSMTVKGKTYSFVFNPMRSLRIVMDENQQIVKIIDYGDDGLITKDTLPSLRVDFAYAGGIWDEDASLLFFPQGVYDPSRQAWLSKIKNVDIITNLKQLNALAPHDVYRCNATLDVYYHAYLCTANQCGGLYATQYLDYFNTQGAVIDNSPYFNHTKCRRIELTSDDDAVKFSHCVQERISPRQSVPFDAFSHNCHHEAADIIATCKAYAKKGRS